jgi:sugar/nucleoside kinase (ribokinase family)
MTDIINASTARVHVAGNTGVDVLVHTPEALPDEGAHTWGANTVLVDDPIVMTMGGGGAAPAYILGRLGQQVSLNTNIGDDRPGHMLTTWLREVNVDILTPPPFPLATTVHVVQLDSQARRRSAYYAGDKVSWRHSADLATPDWLLVSGYGLVDDEDVDELGKLFATSRQRGTKVVFDPSPWFAGRVSAERMLNLWTNLDGLVATEDELAQWLPAASAAELTRAALAAGPSWVVAKLGGAGALYASGDGSDLRAVSTEPMSGTSSIGAGDTLNGRLLYGLSTGEPLATAVAEAVSLATNTVRNGRGVLAAFENLPTASDH